MNFPKSHSFIVLLVSMVISSQALPPSLQLFKPTISQRAMARSLLDLVTNGQVSGGGSGSADNDKDKSSILDLAQTFIQGTKNNDNNNSIYLKLFKLIMNLFMDLMMDRMSAKRREDSMGGNQISWIDPSIEQQLQSKFIQPYIVPKVQQSLESRPAFKPYFVN